MNKPITASLLPKRIRQIYSEVYFLPISFKFFCIFLFFYLSRSFRRTAQTIENTTFYKKETTVDLGHSKKNVQDRPSFIMGWVKGLEPGSITASVR